MKPDVSVLKHSSSSHLSDENSSVIRNNSDSSSSTFESNNDDCDEYKKFIEEMDELHSKVRSGDLSDFEEFEE